MGNIYSYSFDEEDLLPKECVSCDIKSQDAIMCHMCMSDLCAECYIDHLKMCCYSH